MPAQPPSFPPFPPPPRPGERPGSRRRELRLSGRRRRRGDAVRQLRAACGARLRRQPLPARHLPGGCRQRHGPEAGWRRRRAGGCEAAAEASGGVGGELGRSSGPPLTDRARPARGAAGGGPGLPAAALSGGARGQQGQG